MKRKRAYKRRFTKLFSKRVHYGAITFQLQQQFKLPIFTNTEETKAVPATWLGASIDMKKIWGDNKKTNVIPSVATIELSDFDDYVYYTPYQFKMVTTLIDAFTLHTWKIQIPEKTSIWSTHEEKLAAKPNDYVKIIYHPFDPKVGNANVNGPGGDKAPREKKLRIGQTQTRKFRIPFQRYITSTFDYAKASDLDYSYDYWNFLAKFGFHQETHMKFTNEPEDNTMGRVGISPKLLIQYNDGLQTGMKDLSVSSSEDYKKFLQESAIYITLSIKCFATWKFFSPRRFNHYEFKRTNNDFRPLSAVSFDVSRDSFSPPTNMSS